MDNVTIGIIATLAGLGLVALRIQIGVALGIASFFGIASILNMKAAWGIVTAVPFNFVGDWNLTAVPMFLLMGYVAYSSGLTTGLFTAMRVLLSRLPGGLAVASVGACALLAAASGSSVATSSAMARIATPEMLRYGYDPGLASGVIASAGTLGSLIPPSILMILYGYFAEVSIAKLFIGGFIPGLLSALMFSLMIIGRATVDPTLAPAVNETFTREQKIAAFREVWPMPVLIIGVLTGIFVGVFTPTEAGAVGALLAILLAVVRRSLSWRVLWDAAMNTIVGTAGIFMVVIGTALLGKLMALSRLPTFLTEELLLLGGDKYSVILIVVVLYLILGMFLELDRHPSADAADPAADHPRGRHRPDLVRHHPDQAARDRSRHAAGRAERLRHEGGARESRRLADHLQGRHLVHRHRPDHVDHHHAGADPLALAAWNDGLATARKSPRPASRGQHLPTKKDGRVSPCRISSRRSCHKPPFGTLPSPPRSQWCRHPSAGPPTCCRLP